MVRAVGVGVAVTFLVGCSKSAPTSASPDGGAPGPPAASGSSAPAFELVDPGYGPEVHSLLLERSIVLRQKPDSRSAPIGTIAQDMRVLWSRAAKGQGCPRIWVEIEPRGWVCSTHLKPDKRPPRAVELPRVPEGSVVPGLYGKVIGGRTRAFKTLRDARRRKGGRALADATLVRFNKEISFGRHRFWRTTQGELVDARKVMPKDPSRMGGIELGTGRSPLLPLGWIRSGKPATVWEEPERWIEVGELPPRSIVPVLRRSKDGASVRIGPGLWIDARAVHVARLVPPPPGVGPDEKWIDVDLAEQVLVAYEGTRPVFATLVSTGDKNPTPTGMWRIWIKFAETEMDGQVKGKTYQVADVPWTMFFHRSYALHGVYWHDRFGVPTSSGCVNLAPADARFLYHWTDPPVPDGWTMSYPTQDTPGTLVRIRNGLDRAIPKRGQFTARAR
jgi:L,D-transpeptidase catalytic domain